MAIRQGCLQPERRLDLPAIHEAAEIGSRCEQRPPGSLRIKALGWAPSNELLAAILGAQAAPDADIVIDIIAKVFHDEAFAQAPGSDGSRPFAGLARDRAPVSV